MSRFPPPICPTCQIPHFHNPHIYRLSYILKFFIPLQSFSRYETPPCRHVSAFPQTSFVSSRLTISSTKYNNLPFL
ncbi:hypothetical protein O3M35_013166 [Rhynocoris fuscipes]|uniref:Uncharacterized protein n=1 Tax=Rhynocoris fuscipes TaxID=488301 RepID=A0AAW1CER6_9HEMI